MAKYRKKPVVIEAFQFTGQTNTDPGVPSWFVDSINDGSAHWHDEELIIETLEGDLHASLGDWIIQGIQGEIYPCKPDIFAATYEPA